LFRAHCDTGRQRPPTLLIFVSAEDNLPPPFETSACHRSIPSLFFPVYWASPVFPPQSASLHPPKRFPLYLNPKWALPFFLFESVLIISLRLSFLLCPVWDASLVRDRETFCPSAQLPFRLPVLLSQISLAAAENPPWQPATTLLQNSPPLFPSLLLFLPFPLPPNYLLSRYTLEHTPSFIPFTHKTRFRLMFASFRQTILPFSFYCPYTPLRLHCDWRLGYMILFASLKPLFRGVDFTALFLVVDLPAWNPPFKFCLGIYSISPRRYHPRATACGHAPTSPHPCPLA